MSYVDPRQQTPFRATFSPTFASPAHVVDSGYSSASNSSIAREFANSFDYFQSSDSGLVTRQTLEHVANRPLNGDPYNGRMTLLAREILTRPDMSHLFDAINHCGSAEGVISGGDIDRVIAHYEAQEGRSMPQAPDRYQGMMQRQRLGDQWAPQGNWPKPAYGGARAIDLQGPSAALIPDQRPYANDSDQALLDRLHVQFSAFEDSSKPGHITDRSLAQVVAGCRSDGCPATSEEMALARELRERGGLFKKMDRDGMGKLDGAVSRDEMNNASLRVMSDHELIQTVKDNFRQYTAGAKDKYVNENELKAAAGLIPSSRTFSPEAKQAATELLNRPGLFRELDIGIKRESGKPGAEDRRFDMDNLNLLLNTKRAPAA